MSGNPSIDTIIVAIDSTTNRFTTLAAKGEVPWVCPDCSQYFERGMPEECLYQHELCTKLMHRDRKVAFNSTGSE